MSGVVRLQFSSLELLSLCFCLLSAGRTRGDQHGVVKVFAAEGSDVILPCSLSTKENIQSKVFDWKKDGRKDEREVLLYDAGVHYNNGRGGQSETFKGRVSHFQDQLKYGIASITIRNTRVTDRGNYTCHFPRLQPPQTFYVELVVDRDPQFSTLKNKNGETDGAAEPYISIVDVTEVGVQLKCDVRGAFPQPKLQWRDSDGNVLPADEPRVSERGRRYDVTLQIIVNRTATNRFSCVVKQEDIGHMVDANFTVPEKLFEDVSCKGEVTGWIGGFFLGAFIILAVQALLVAAKLITIHRYKDSCEKTKCSCDDNQEKPLNPQPVNGSSVPVTSLKTMKSPDEKRNKHLRLL